MNQSVGYTLVFVWIICFCLFFILVLNHRNRGQPSIKLLVSFLLVYLLAFYVTIRGGTAVRLKYLSQKMALIMSDYVVDDGTYPKNINDLQKHSMYRQTIFSSMYPFSMNFGFKVMASHGNTEIVFYAYGFDSDDDNLSKTYDLTLANALNPLLDGDIVVVRNKTENH